jgi:two-component sensor histidine kinase
LAMALHELTTIAMKYGALSQKNGRLNIRWSAAVENGSPWINIDWKETGIVIARSAPRKAGGGSGRRLIEEALPYQFGARTTFAIEPDGLHCTIALPLSEPRSEEIRDGQPGAS